MTKTALITGSNGFIGKHLSDRLLSDGFKVAQFPRASLFDYDSVVKVIEEVKPDYIFHLAAYGNFSTQKDEDQMLISNILATFFLLKASKCKFIYFSSSSVYGEKKKTMSENHSLDTDTFYGCTKASAEFLCRAFAKKYDRDIAIIRPFSVYGEGEDDSRFIPTVINKILNDEELYLDSNAVHDWIYIQDFINGVMLVKDKKGTFNIGTGHQYSNFEIYNFIADLMNKGTEVKKIDNMRESSPKVWRANINKINKLGFRTITIQEGLGRTLSYYLTKYVS